MIIYSKKNALAFNLDNIVYFKRDGSFIHFFGTDGEQYNLLVGKNAATAMTAIIEAITQGQRVLDIDNV